MLVLTYMFADSCPLGTCTFRVFLHLHLHVAPPRPVSCATPDAAPNEAKDQHEHHRQCGDATGDRADSRHVGGGIEHGLR